MVIVCVKPTPSHLPNTAFGSCWLMPITGMLKFIPPPPTQPPTSDLLTVKAKLCLVEASARWCFFFPPSLLNLLELLKIKPHCFFLCCEWSSKINIIVVVGVIAVIEVRRRKQCLTEIPYCILMSILHCATATAKICG